MIRIDGAARAQHLLNRTYLRQIIPKSVASYYKDESNRLAQTFQAADYFIGCTIKTLLLLELATWIMLTILYSTEWFANNKWVVVMIP